MKNTLIFGAAAAALMMAAAPAHANGYVGLSYQDADDANVESTAISGSALLTGHIQVDGSYANLEAGGADADLFNIGGHAFVRDQQWMWGGYLGFSNLDAGGGADIDEWTLAAQAAYYMARTTLSGSLGYSEADTGGPDVETIALDGEARHFFTDNFSGQFNAGFGNAEQLGVDVDFTTVGVGAEFQLASAPVSFYGGYQHIDVDGGGDNDSIGVGVRWNWGGSLIERNRSGAGLNRPLGFIERSVGEISPR